jgi:hypothetical protein
MKQLIAKVLIGLVALASLANGAFMLIAPLTWYETIETVKLTGPPNIHFLRDIGLAYLVCGALLAYGAVDPKTRMIALVAGSLWLTAHGALHIYEVLTGICTTATFLADTPAVIVPPLLAWIGIALHSRQAN